MDQELRQRLVGAFVITALLAIFVPMLFDDDVDQTGKNINQLTIPEVPAKAQEVEIMPLPEKAEDVATVIPVEKPGVAANNASVLSEGEGDPVAAPNKSSLTAPAASASVAAKTNTAVKAGPGQTFEGDADVPQGLIAEDELPLKPTGKPVKALPAIAAPAAVVTAPTLQNNQVNAAAAVAQPVVKPLVKPAAPAPVAAVNANVAAPVAPAKQAVATPEGATRWYLNAGSFTQRANATALQESLKHQGFAATVKDAQGERGPIYKVRIGPIQDKAKAQEVKNRLLQINVNTFVAADE